MFLKTYFNSECEYAKRDVFKDIEKASKVEFSDKDLLTQN